MLKGLFCNYFVHVFKGSLGEKPPRYGDWAPVTKEEYLRKRLLKEEYLRVERSTVWCSFELSCVV